MLIKQLNKKLILTDLTNTEKLAVRRNCVNVKSTGATLTLDDNLFNRTYLQYSPETFYETKITVGEDELNPLLRDYQRKDVMGMLQLENVLNRNKPGYGKTFEAIEYCRLKNFKNIYDGNLPPEYQVFLEDGTFVENPMNNTFIFLSLANQIKIMLFDSEQIFNKFSFNMKISLFITLNNV